MLAVIDPLITLTTTFFTEVVPKPVPEGSEVKAGWTALFLWVAMIVAVGLLGWSLVRQLKRTLAAKEAGIYGEDRKITDGPAFEVDDEGADKNA
ncbi:hypothetical protein [Nocardioides yefusunii]|uniref:Uncharacterized protein n=1 Tax=Nocardioides yefusunii TaxID=2500546 RepID=A0ABW1QTQ6_9ACTN|nr:hypothetical protein [Nocardioides yefusunii]